jgi:ABC-type Fe3+ transport system permease subunit
MWVTIFEVALFALIAVVLLAPWVPRVLRRRWPRAADTDQPSPASNESVSSAAGPDAGRRRWAGRIGGVLFALAIANFLAYSVHTQNLGGGADSYKPEEGRYFVSSHGKYTEVTEEQWRTVRTHGIATYVTHAIGLLVGVPLIAYNQGWRSAGSAGANTPNAASVQG